MTNFHQLGRLGRVGLVVAKSVCVCVSVCPLPMRFFFLRGWTGAERASSVDWCGLCHALAWSPKNGEVFQIGPPPPFLTPGPPQKNLRGGDGGDDDKDGNDDKDGGNDGGNDNGGRGGGEICLWQKKNKNAISPQQKYWCYYPHWSRELVSPECGIFF